MNICKICLNTHEDEICPVCINLFIFMYEHNSFDDEYFLENPLLCIFSYSINEKNIDKVSWNKINLIQKKSRQRIEYKKMLNYDSYLDINLDKFLNSAQYIEMGILDKIDILNNNEKLKNEYDFYCKNREEQIKIDYHNEISYQINLELPLNKNALMYCLEQSEQQGYNILVKRIREVLGINDY